MAETVTSLFGGHRQPADTPPVSWPTVRPTSCLQSFAYATPTSSAPSSSTGPPRLDADDSLTSHSSGDAATPPRLRHTRSRPFNYKILARQGPRLPFSIRPLRKKIS